MHEPRTKLVNSPGGAPGAQAQTWSRAPTAGKMVERPTARRDCTALGAAIAPAQRLQQSPIGVAPSECGLAVHPSCAESASESGRGALQLFTNKIQQT